MKRRLWFKFIWLVVAAWLMAACNLPGVGGDDPTVTPTPIEEDQGKPGVVIDSPPSGSTAAMGEEVFVQSTSTDTVGITRVDLQVDGTVVRSDNTPEETPQPQFSLLQAWTAAPGDHTLSVIAYRADGTASDPASVTITVSEEPVAEVEESPTCTAKANTKLNVRQGPGVVYGVIGQLQLGQEVNVTGKLADNSWWQIDFNGAPGWVSAPYTYPGGDCGAVAVAQAPPAPAGGQSGGGSSAHTATPDPAYSPTPSYTPGGPTPTYTYTYTPGGPTPTYTYTPTYTSTPGGPTAVHTATFTPSYTPTTQPAAQQAPPDSNFNAPLNIPLDNTASVLDFVSYPGGDTEDRVRWDITGMNPNASLSGGKARLIIAVSCFGTGIEYVQVFTGGQTYSCGDTIVDKEVTYDSRTGQVTITAIGGSETYVQWVLTGTATRTN